MNKISELTPEQIQNRINQLFTSAPARVLDVYNNYFSTFRKDQNKKWLFYNENNDTYDFVYCFDIQNPPPDTLEFLIKNIQNIHDILKTVAIELFQKIKKFNTSTITIDKSEFIQFNLTQKVTIHSHAIHEISAPYWLYPIVRAQQTEREQGIHLLCSAIIHELEHYAKPIQENNTSNLQENTLADVEEITTFVEYLSTPLHLPNREDQDVRITKPVQENKDNLQVKDYFQILGSYLQEVKNYLIEQKERTTLHSHSIPFYKTFILFVKKLKEKPPFNNIPAFRDFQEKNFEEQFDTLKKLRELCLEHPETFFQIGLELREELYKKTSKQFQNEFKEAERYLNIKRTLN